jgi:hypothetical protein
VKDLNSVKAYRREIMDTLPVRPDWHRYMIVIAAAEGFTVTEIPVPLYPAARGTLEVRAVAHSRSACSTCCRCGSSCASERSRCSFRHGRRGTVRARLRRRTRRADRLATRTSASEPCGRSSRRASSSAACCSPPGLLGEQIAGQRAEVRELRRQLDELKLRDE